MALLNKQGVIPDSEEREKGQLLPGLGQDFQTVNSNK